MANIPPLAGEGRESTRQRYSNRETHQVSQSYAASSGNSSNEADDTLRKLFDREIENRTEIIKELGQLVQNITYGPSKTAMNELRIHVLSQVADILESDFERLGTVESLEKSFECRSKILSLMPDGHRGRLYQLATFATSLMLKIEQHGSNLEDIDRAIYYLGQAMQFTPDGDPVLAGTLINGLGTSYRRRFEHLGEPADLDQAIEYYTQAVSLIPDGYILKQGMCYNLGFSYMRRFQRLDELADLDQVTQWYTKAVQLTPDDHPDKPRRLNNLGNSCLRRFERLGELEDLEQASQCLAQAVQLTPDDHPDKLDWLNNLGLSLLGRLEHLDQLADLDKAIQCLTHAMQLAPDNHPDKPEVLNNLGVSCQTRFERRGELADLDQAIQCLIQAVQLTPHGHKDTPRTLNNLGRSLLARFDRLGGLADLDQAIQRVTQAMQLATDGHPYKPGMLGNLGNSYMRRFERLGDLEDLDQAIQCQTQAVQLAPDGDRVKRATLSNLGVSYMHRFDRLDEFADVDQAIQCQTQAVQLTPDGHPYKLATLNNLGISYQSRFERLGELADLDQAIQCLTQAVQLTPDGHPEKPTTLGNLGSSYKFRFNDSGCIEDQESSLLAFQHAAQLVLTNPQTQLASARGWAQSCHGLGVSPQQAYERCMELVPHVVWLGTTIERRYDLLKSVSDLATEAASWAISVGSYDLAVEWLEQGRSIVWNQILQLRTPFDDLSAHAPVLAQRLKDIASQLERAGSQQTTIDDRSSTQLDLETAAQQHRRLASQWEECLEEARRLPGFGNFMRPRNSAELKTAATDGPVILINNYPTRWDALIIFPRCGEITHVPLVKLSPDETSEFHAQLFLEYLAGHRGESARGFSRKQVVRKTENPFKTSLRALWTAVVEPILQALGCTNKLLLEELPHITWCATGPLAFAPLHAAGAYDGSSRNAIDLVISSYTPSLSALLPSSATTTQPDVGVLAIGQQYTRGQCELPYTIQELAVIKVQAQGIRYSQLDGMNATVDAVLGAMVNHGWIHLACHAIQHQDNPAHSAFLLHDGELTLEMITRQQFTNKGLAFLSACQTAKGDGKLPDEAVHLAAGMLMAGYPSVIATMWSISDADGPEVARGVYAELLKQGNMDHREAARALHKAVSELREKIGVESFERWVPFIHIGV